MCTYSQCALGIHSPHLVTDSPVREDEPRPDVEGHVEGNFTDGISHEGHNAMYGILVVSQTLVDCRMTSWVKEGKTD